MSVVWTVGRLGAGVSSGIDCWVGGVFSPFSAAVAFVSTTVSFAGVGDTGLAWVALWLVLAGSCVLSPAAAV